LREEQIKNEIQTTLNTNRCYISNEDKKINCLRYYQQNKHILKLQMKIHYLQNKHYWKAYYTNNKDKYKKANDKWYEKNKHTLLNKLKKRYISKKNIGKV
jgi:hypothetical protein